MQSIMQSQEVYVVKEVLVPSRYTPLAALKILCKVIQLHAIIISDWVIPDLLIFSYFFQLFDYIFMQPTWLFQGQEKPAVNLAKP